MNQVIRNVLIIFLSGASMLAAEARASADVLYDSIANAIETVTANAMVNLEQGYYATDNGRSRLIWAVAAGTKAKIKFHYGLGSIQSGMIDFGAKGTTVVVRSELLCSKISIRKIAVDVGGALDEANSDFTLEEPGPDCKEPRSQLTGALEDSLVLNQDPSKLFTGSVFSGSDNFRKCPDSHCHGKFEKFPLAQPITKLTLYGDESDSTIAFNLKLFRGASIVWPNSAGFVKLGADSGLQITNATYTPQNKTGGGKLQNLSLAVDDGSLVFGSTSLMLAKGSSFAFDNLQIRAGDGSVSATGGSFTGTLGANSQITLDDSNVGKSSIAIAQASASLIDLDMEFQAGEASITGKSGKVSIEANSADLSLSPTERLLLGTTTLGLVFACPVAEPDCHPFHWTRGGLVEVIGQITPVYSSVRGGHILFPGQNELQIDLGEIQTSDLRIDTRDNLTPITGRMTKLDLNFSTTDWKVDSNTRIGAGTLRLYSEDIGIDPGDQYPTGKLVISGKIRELSSSGVGDFLMTGNSTFNFPASRQFRDEIKIEDGKVDGNVHVKGNYNALADATLKIEDILYYRGVGDAKVSFHVENASASYTVSEPDQRAGFPGGQTVASMTPRTIGLALQKRFGLDKQEIKFSNGKWSMPEQNIPVSVALTVATGELVNVNVQLGNPSIGIPYKTVCSPHVNINTGSYTLNGHIVLSLAGAGGKFKAAVDSLVPAFDADVDDRGCKTITEGICALVGSMGGGLIGVAMGIACGDKVEEFKKQAHEKMADAADSAVKKLSVESTF